MLRLLETFSMAEVTKAVEDALRLRAISFDAVKHLLLCRIEQRPPRLDLQNYPYLPMAQVATTAAADYLALLTPCRKESSDGDSSSFAGAPPEGAKTADLPARVRQGGAAVRRRGVDYPRYLLRLSEQELLDRERRATERRIQQARFRVVKSPGQFRLSGDSVAEQSAGSGAGPQ